jgi:hypothetical protein
MMMMKVTIMIIEDLDNESNTKSQEDTIENRRRLDNNNIITVLSPNDLVWDPENVIYWPKLK